MGVITGWNGDARYNAITAINFLVKFSTIIEFEILATPN
jgi:hypothetical protein